MGFQNDHPIAFPILGCSPSFKKKTKRLGRSPFWRFLVQNSLSCDPEAWPCGAPTLRRMSYWITSSIYSCYTWMLLIILSWYYILKCHIYIYVCVCVWLEWSSSGLRDVENPWLWHPKMAGLEAIRSLSCPFPKSRWCLRNEHDWTCSSELEYGFCNKEHIYIHILYIL